MALYSELITLLAASSSELPRKAPLNSSKSLNPSTDLLSVGVWAVVLHEDSVTGGMYSYTCPADVLTLGMDAFL